MKKGVWRGAAAALAAALMIGTTPALALTQTSFPADLRGHWASQACWTMLSHGVMTTADDGSFQPDKALTGSAAAALMEQLGMAAGDGWQTRATITRGDFSMALEQGLRQWQGPAGAVPPPPGEGNTISGAGNTSSDSWKNADGTVDRAVVWAAMPAQMQQSLDPKLWDLFSEADWQAWALMYAESSPDADQQTAAAASFSDLQGHPSAQAVQALQLRGVVTGSGGLFRTDAPITRGEAAAMVQRAMGWTVETYDSALPQRLVIEVPYISQLSPVYAPVGCEPTSLLMGLKAMGYAQDVDLYTFLTDLPKTESNPAKGFAGSPFRADPTKTTRTTIYPPALAAYGSQYGPVRDISGSTPSQLQQEVLSGHPVVAYVTMWWEKPYYRTYNIEGESQRLLSNNHAVLVCGYDQTENAYYIADPYNLHDKNNPLFYWIGADTFDPIYMERCHALAVG